MLQVDNSCRLAHDFTATTHEGSIDQVILSSFLILFVLQVAFQPDGPNVFASAGGSKHFFKYF